MFLTTNVLLLTYSEISRINKITYGNTNPAIRNINFNNHNSILLGIIVPLCGMAAYCAIRRKFSLIL